MRACIIISAMTLISGVASFPLQVGEGKALYDQSWMGHHSTEFLTRNDHRVTSPEGL